MFVFSKVKCFLLNVYKSLRFCYVFLLDGIVSNKIGYSSNKGRNIISVLANGPSLKQVLVSKSFSDEDLIVVNFFAFDDSFFSLKPKHYCLVDPMFFIRQHNYENVAKLYEIFNNKINWDLNLYIPSKYYKKFKSFSNISNNHINIIPVNNIPYDGFPTLTHYLYKNGFSAPTFFTVANMAEYVAINLGYNLIQLYGVDHTFFDGLCVNASNQVCCKQVHFYDETTEVNYVPIKRNDNGKYWKMSDYIHSIANMFGSHDAIAKYADYIGCKVINCTKGSLIDSFDRLNDE